MEIQNRNMSLISFDHSFRSTIAKIFVPVVQDFFCPWCHYFETSSTDYHLRSRLSFLFDPWSRRLSRNNVTNPPLVVSSLRESYRPLCWRLNSVWSFPFILLSSSLHNRCTLWESRTLSESLLLFCNPLSISCVITSQSVCFVEGLNFFSPVSSCPKSIAIASRCSSVR